MGMQGSVMVFQFFPCNTSKFFPANGIFWRDGLHAIHRAIEVELAHLPKQANIELTHYFPLE